MLYEKYLNAINEKREKILGVADAIWDTPELAFGEYRSSETLQKALEEEGFAITRSIAGIPTAFRAEFGSGRPAIGILAEFDALPNLNYQAGVTEPLFRADAQNGHGCGHRSEKIRAGNRKGQHHAFRLPRRGKRRRQGLYGKGRNLQ